MGKVRIVLVALVSMLYTTAQEVTVKGVLENTAAYYTGKDNYRINMTFSLLQGFTGKKVTESYKGIMDKHGDYVKTVFQESEVHQFPKVQLTMDNVNKTATLSELSLDNNNPAQMASLLQYYTKSQKIVDGGKTWICELVAEHQMFSQLPYGKILLYVSKKDYRMVKQVFYFKHLVPFRDNDSKKSVRDQARLLIEFNHDFKAMVERKELTDFMIREDNGNRLTEKYASFQLIDRTK